MAAPGHRPMKNTDRQELGRSRLAADRPELARNWPEGSARRTSKISHPHYRPRRRETAARRRSTSFVTEASAAVAVEVLRDVAAASFGITAANTDPHIAEVVLGADDRVRVTPESMAMNPWRQICALRIVSQTDRTFVGTGWFIAPDVLATAGHCVFLQDEGGWAKSIRVIPAKQGAQEPFGSQTSLRFASVDGWVERRQRDFDYGVIFLDDSSVGNQLGNFAVSALDAAELRGSDGQISGYPADRDNAAFQYFHARPMIDVTDTRLVYDIDTFGGQSGSPIWQETEESGVVAVGIHTTGSVSSNSGTRISADVLDNLVSWITE
jgi:V8-like Glu-specific endopeptidase